MVTARKAAAAVCGESGKKKREGKGTWADRVEWERLV
jgi:hypothetical protein